MTSSPEANSHTGPMTDHLEQVQILAPVGEELRTLIPSSVAKLGNLSCINRLESGDYDDVMTGGKKGDPYVGDELYFVNDPQDVVNIV